MSLKFRLAFLYSLSVFIILLASAVSIFLFNENFRKDEFARRLVSEGSESIQMFLSAPGPPKSIIEDLDRFAANSSHATRVYIFDSTLKLLYSSRGAAAPPVSPKIFNLAKVQGDYFFTEKASEFALLYRTRKGQAYYILTSGYDVYGRRKSDNLKVLLSLSVLGGILLSGFLASFYVRQIMNPLEELKTQIEKIDERNLEQRIAVANRNTEVWQIAQKFNEMLDRLEQAFEQRKNFVRHASHELRTPLANMLSQTESALSKNLRPVDYRDILISLKEDQQDLIDLTNSLLTLSRYGKITTETDWTTIRIDEIVYEVVDFAKQIWPTALVTIDFSTVPESETELELHGNESLIKSAVQNLVKNAIHYSVDNHVRINIIAEENGITLHIENVGKQLTTEEQSRVFIPFFRGENAANKKGYGLGLSIVQRIIHVHRGTITYEAVGNDTNRFTAHFPKG